MKRIKVDDDNKITHYVKDLTSSPDIIICTRLLFECKAICLWQGAKANSERRIWFEILEKN
jgi:hypothetical protein